MGDNMNVTAARLIGVLGTALLFLMHTPMALADDFKQLSAEWWQWTLSFPVAESPQLDATGERCAVGQRGSVWFLVGNFGGTTTRSCSVPEGKTVFFPVVNSVNVDSPNVCGQGPDRTPLPDLRALPATSVDGAIGLVVEVDGKPIKTARRVQSRVCEVALPIGNVFDATCAAFGGVPAGIYSPAVDDGIYVELQPLAIGNQVVHIHAENPKEGFLLDVTYNLEVVPVVLR
jgi:hypothetical protein